MTALHIAVVGLLLSGLVLVARSGAPAGSSKGCLRAHPANPRYFTDGTGGAIYLTGFHTWTNLQDWGTSAPPEPFDYEAYLDLLEEHNANFIRLWRWEMPRFRYPAAVLGPSGYYCAPHPWPRPGPGTAEDGKPKFDLTRFDQAYFNRMRERVIEAGRRGIYVSIMLFEGHCMQFAEEGWRSHPFNGQNNMNGINVYPDGGGRGLAFYTLEIPEVTALQEAYVSKVIDTVNDLDNVLYEICNEAGPYSTQWQYHMIRFIKGCEAGKPKQHPVGMTFQYKGGSNADLFKSPADWISPNPEGGYQDNPPASEGDRVVISDTDHLWGIGGNHVWVWKSFLRGLHPIYMDPFGERTSEEIRKNLGYTRMYASKMDLAGMTPRNDLASTGYCLASLGREYLVYLDAGGTATVDISDVEGAATLEWFNPRTGAATDGGTVQGGQKRSFKPPFDGDAVLYIAAKQGVKR